MSAFHKAVVTTVTSVVLDFLTAAFLMLLVGAAGWRWGYWHAWWLTVCGTGVISGCLFPITYRLDAMKEAA